MDKLVVLKKLCVVAALSLILLCAAGCGKDDVDYYEPFAGVPNAKVLDVQLYQGLDENGDEQWFSVDAEDYEPIMEKLRAIKYRKEMDADFAERDADLSLSEPDWHFRFWLEDGSDWRICLGDVEPGVVSKDAYYVISEDEKPAVLYQSWCTDDPHLDREFENDRIFKLYQEMTAKYAE